MRVQCQLASLQFETAWKNAMSKLRAERRARCGFCGQKPEISHNLRQDGIA